MILESLALCGSAGLLGVGLALLLEDGTARFLTNAGLPGFEVAGQTVATGLALAAGLGLAAGALPGWRAARLVPVGALRAQA
jgi:ABC-type antimicrobial peptide transport system permease subunit